VFHDLYFLRDFWHSLWFSIVTEEATPVELSLEKEADAQLNLLKIAPVELSLQKTVSATLILR